MTQTGAPGPWPPVEHSTPSRPNAALVVLRHVASLVIALGAVPIALLLADYAVFHGYQRVVTTLDEGAIEGRSAGFIVLAGLLLLVAAGAGRLSGLGPLVAGLVWGVVPTLWLLVQPLGFLRRLTQLPDLYDNLGYGLSGSALVVFPVVAGLLLGTAVAGRWSFGRR